MANRKKRYPTILHALGFGLATLLLFSFLTLLLEPDSDDTKTRKSFYAERPQSLDMVCIGGSVCWMGWAPYEAWQHDGLASYTYGLSAMDSFYLLPIVKEVLAYQSPRLLVIDLRPFEYAGVRKHKKETGLNLLSSMPLWSPNRYETAIKAYLYADNISELDTLDTFLIDLTRYHDRWSKLNGDSFRWAFVGHESYNTKGYRLLSGQMDVKLTDHSTLTATAPIDPKGEADLRELLAYLKARGQQAVFVVVNYQESEMERRRYNALASIIRAEGFSYLNGNDYAVQMQLKSTLDFYNENHLNIYGAEKFTRTVADLLVAQFSLPDRRGDPAYESWETGYKNWEKTAAETKQATLDYMAKHAAEKKNE